MIFDPSHGLEVDRGRIRTVICPAVAAFLMYVNGFYGDFVHDDIPAIIRNPDVNGKNNITQLFFDDFWGVRMSHPLSHKSYRPVTVLVFRFCYWIGDGHPLPFHWVNGFLHTLSTIFVSYISSSRLRLDPAITMTVSVLFALHPIHTETVSGIVGCADLLSTVFLLISFITYTRSSIFYFPEKNENKFWFYGLSLLSAVLALLSKETGISALVINAAFVFILEPGKTMDLRRISTDILSFVILLGSRLAIQRQTLPEFSESDNPAAFHPEPLTRFLTFLYLPVHNFWLMLCPCYLSYDWQMGSIPLVHSPLDPRNLFSILFYGGLWSLLRISGVFEMKKTVWNRSIVTALLFLALPFLPATNLFFPVGFVIAERILYLPSVGFCLLVGLGFDRLRSSSILDPSIKRRKRKTLFIFFIVLLCTIFSAKTLRRNLDWSSRETLFRSGFVNSPSNAKMHYNFANLLRDSGKIESAISHYKEAIRLWPNYVLAHNNLATLLNDQRQVEYHLRKALEVNPAHPNSLYNMASLLRNRGLCERAIPLLERCIEVNQYDQAAYSLLFECLRETNRLENDHYVPIMVHGKNESAKGVRTNSAKLRQDLVPKETTETISPEQNIDFLSQLAEIYISLTKYGKARNALQKILEIEPSHKLALYQLSQVYLEQNMKEDAMKTIRLAQELCDQTLDTCFDYCRQLCNRILIQKGDVHRESKQYDHAITHYSLALEMNPSEPQLLLSLGASYHALGEWEEARKRYYECMRLDPNNSILLINMERLVRAEKAANQTSTATKNEGTSLS